MCSNTAPRFGSTDVTGEIMHVNIVVGKVGPIRKIVFVPRNTKEFDLFVIIIIIIIMAEMAVFYVAGYLIEERRRWPVITASPRGQCSK